MAGPRRGTGATILVTVLLVLTMTTGSSAQSSGFIRLSPGQGEVGITVEVNGSEFGSAAACGDVRILFDGELVATTTPVGDGSTESPTFTTTFTVPDRPVGRYEVVADQTSEGCPFTDDTSFDVLAFDVDPSVGPVGTTVTATGAGFRTDVFECGFVTITFDGELVEEDVAPQGEGGTFSVTFTVPERAPGTYLVEANQTRVCGVGGDIRGEADFTVVLEPTETETPTDEPTTEPPTEEPTTEPPTEEPTTEPPTEEPTTEPPTEQPTEPPGPPPSLVLDPAVGPPGSVTTVTGTGFSPGSTLLLTWQPGIGAVRVVVDAQGNLQTPMLVFHRDRLGSRDLQATVVGLPEVVASATYLVVPGTGQPGNFTFRR